ncbi:anterior gradient 1 [Nelusetta ayraudi]|uniref:anterior gradient 1 n=1 Tax=Nelusetta ayraudi TaxID=303726 RepID=UPI003F6EAB1A
MMLHWVLLALLLGSAACASAGQQKEKKLEEKKEPHPLSRGWGDDISWVESYEDGLSEMKKSQKPLMVIHHLDDCQHSQALKKAFVAQKELQQMAEQDFIMVNLVEETTDENMAPDGYYVPRILFVDPSMTVRTDITGRYSNHLYTYEPKDMSNLAENMKKAKVLFKNEL